jgi:hypothetical protein
MEHLHALLNADALDPLTALALMKQLEDDNVVPVALRHLLDHQRSWDMEPPGRTADSFEEGGRIDEPWVEWDAGKFESAVGVNPRQFLQICDEHRLFPDKIQTKKRCACTKEFGIFLVLRRFNIMEGSFRKLQLELRGDRTRLQDIYATMMCLYESKYDTLATKVDIFRISKRGNLQRLASATTKLGGKVHFVILFIDGKPVFVTRPSCRAATNQDIVIWDVQRLFYNGHYKGHGVRLQYALFTDGICVMQVTSLREHDQTNLNESGLENALRTMVITDEHGGR